ncbi:formylmethanofuran dehydrogenase subunit E [Bradyrhizobium sp. JR1.7]
MSNSRNPVLFVTRACESCGEPFRCPTAQADRFTCGPCMGSNRLPTASEPVSKP